MSEFPFDKVQSRIGYRFNDRRILLNAFTHSSYVNEHGGCVSNERIEFLGDCVLNFLVGLRLYKTTSEDEGALSARRASCVSRAPLARLVDGLGILEFLRVGAGVNKLAFSEKTRSDLFEAIVGAIYLDGGIDACIDFLDRTFFSEVTPEYDYKTELQERAVARGAAPKYSDAKKDGDVFYTTVDVFGKSYVGAGRTKHASQIDAARRALADEK